MRKGRDQSVRLDRATPGAAARRTEPVEPNRRPEIGPAARHYVKPAGRSPNTTARKYRAPPGLTSQIHTCPDVRYAPDKFTREILADRAVPETG